ncbi:LIM-type zinc finger-containing protein [Tieghemostelium lacteum]|uniref:LIM-type zinc finger-containing protein n=1 Tax=Tieghemostelium lacteum TaxID=361077 RepID=A0A151ZK31_TIELA|nr:LIM-type zinc finger-containing protein [Tieghemostelium lacteum]|eukprot:KYQ94287.1 LIM-type zinc finger-containing protein [Tieghemostelium lacteum]
MPLFVCRKCNTRIEDKALKVFGFHYHSQCFVCFDCSTPLSDVYYEINKLPYCKLDYEKPREGENRSPLLFKKNQSTDNSIENKSPIASRKNFKNGSQSSGNLEKSNSNNDFLAELKEKLNISQEIIDNKKNHDIQPYSSSTSSINKSRAMSTDNNNQLEKSTSNNSLGTSNSNNSLSISIGLSGSSNNISNHSVTTPPPQSSIQSGAGGNIGGGKQTYSITHIPDEFSNKQSKYQDPLVSVTLNNKTTPKENGQDVVITQTTTTILSNGKCQKCTNEIYGSCIESHSKQRYHSQCFSCTLCLGSLLEGYFTDNRNGNNYCARCQILLNERNKKSRENAGHCSVCYKRFQSGEFHVVFDNEKFHEACVKCCVCKNQIKDNNFQRELVTSQISNFCCGKCIENGKVDLCGKCDKAIIGGSSLFANGKHYHPNCFTCVSCTLPIKYGSKYAMDLKRNGPRCDSCSEPTTTPTKITATVSAKVVSA